jgi:alkanesulfonate monooxygenase SsuD/methylene tetrahydromethanopterin reductase-like flavin-dependent oxidoreductase (luciferase family)
LISAESATQNRLRKEGKQEGLWDCWDDGAIVANRTTGQFIDARKVRSLDHKGRFFRVKGPINMARCPQGHPVIIQAGGSPAGLELAARTADVVFSVVQDLEAARIAYADLKGRMARYGRSPDELSVLPGVMPIIGTSDAEARETLAKLQAWLTPTNAATLVASRIGYEVAGHPLDGPVPPPPPSEGSQTFSHVLYETARREKMTLRDLYNLTGQHVAIGSPAAHRSALLIHLKNGSSATRRTDTTSCHPTSLGLLQSSLTWWCLSCSVVVFSDTIMKVRRCVIISALLACPLRT